MANTMKFFGAPLTDGELSTAEAKRGTNLIMAFTAGTLEKLKDNGWASEQANNLDHLIDVVKLRVKKDKSLLLLMSKETSTIDFDLLPNAKLPRLGIRIFLPERDGFVATLFFSDVKVGKKKVNNIRLPMLDEVSFYVFPLTVNPLVVAG